MRGIIDAGDPQSGNWFRFRFVFVSCVRASGRGEAVWACEGGVIVNAGGLHSNISCCSSCSTPQQSAVWAHAVEDIISEIGGNEALAEPNREIGFGFVPCSCSACERAGEAKLCGRVRGECFSTLGVSVLTFPPAVVGSWVSPFRFCCYAHGF